VCEAPSVGIDATIADVRALDETTFPVAVVGRGGVLVGAVAATASRLPATTPVVDVMISAPGSIRTEQHVEDVASQLDRDGLDHIFVTTVDGLLVGRVITARLHA
jgi:Mg/Co/Ni transporter MgtE